MLTQRYTAGMTSMDRWIAFDKGDFIGREAALAEQRDRSAPRRLVTLAIEDSDADASGFEPVLHDGRRIGFTTSGGYGHCVERSLAMALVAPEHAESGTRLTTHIVGTEIHAEVIPSSPYDPGGGRMRV